MTLAVMETFTAVMVPSVVSLGFVPVPVLMGSLEPTVTNVLLVRVSTMESVVNVRI